VKARVPVLAIDGFSATGKGTVAAIVAGEWRWHLLDSGVLYRAFAYIAVQEKISPTDISAIRHLGHGMLLRCSYTPGRDMSVVWNETVLSEVLRAESVAQIASQFAEQPVVREILLDQQRANRRPPGLVADGRDMGSRVFPDAAVKVFLTATPEARAERRYKQLNEKGFSASLAEIEKAMNERDKRDQERAVAPTRPMPDAVVVDTTELEIADVVARVRELVLRQYPRVNSPGGEPSTNL